MEEVHTIDDSGARAALDLEGFRLGFDLFVAGREWDAHEVWEGLWRERRGTEAGQLLRGLIQWAAAGVKVRAERPSGASSLVEKALSTWRGLPDVVVFDGGRKGQVGHAQDAVPFDVRGSRAALQAWLAADAGALPVPRCPGTDAAFH